jgi:hypothetical protein
VLQELKRGPKRETVGRAGIEERLRQIVTRRRHADGLVVSLEERDRLSEVHDRIVRAARSDPVRVLAQAPRRLADRGLATSALVVVVIAQAAAYRRAERCRVGEVTAHSLSECLSFLAAVLVLPWPVRRTPAIDQASCLVPLIFRSLGLALSAAG